MAQRELSLHSFPQLGLLLQMVKFLAELCHFGSDHHTAVALAWIVDIIILVILFGHIKMVDGGHFCDDGIVPNVGFVEFVDEAYGRFLLLLIVIKNDRPILRAYVSALPVQCCRVVDSEENRGKSTVIKGGVEFRLRFSLLIYETRLGESLDRDAIYEKYGRAED